MEVSRLENLPPPPGIIRSIKAGFDVIASHITAIAMPLLLNVFLWLGPRLRMEAMFGEIQNDVVSIWKASGVPAADIQSVLTWYEMTLPKINLFWLTRTLPIGISSLLLPHGPESTPLGVPAIWQVNVLNFPGWILLLTFVGWVGGAIYFRSVAWVSISDNEQTIQVSGAIFQTALISFFFAVALIALGMPLLLILFIVSQFSAVLANLFVLFVSLASVWVIVPLFFWPHGVFLNKQNVLTSIMSSIQLARFTLPTSSLFVLVVFLLAYGLNFLWSIPSEDSWMTLFGIFGHAFVTTALLASSFIYYRDMSAWIQAVLEKLRPSNVVNNQA